MRRDVRQPGRPKKPVQKDELISVAGETFANAGFAGASMNTIAEGAGIRKSSLFHHFDNKNHLYREVLLGILRELEQLVTGVTGEPGSYMERLDLMGDRLLDYIEGHPFSPVLILREAIDDHLFQEEEGSKAVTAALSGLSAFMAAGAQAGEFVSEDPRQLAFSFVSLHFLYFAAFGLVSRFTGQEVHEPAAFATRRQVVKAQVRRLCAAG